MKLTTLLLLFAIMQVSAMTYAQKVSLNVRNSPLSSILDQISDQTGYNFFYSNSALNDTKPVSLNVRNMELSDVLQQLFAGQPLGFTIQDKNVVIKEKTFNNNVKTQLKPELALITVNGKITDETGFPIIGASIKVKGSNLGWMTNLKGEFNALIADPNAILQVSFIGYLPQEIPISRFKNPDVVVIVLKEDISKLDEVQVIAYGTTTKRVSTGDITIVDSKTIAQYPTNNVLDALQGTVPGLTIYKNTGNVTGTYKVQIRGINGLNNGSPLYVIDGVPFQGGSVTSLNSTSGGSSANGQSNKAYDAMSLINPDDIESISILKDADATAIYGSRGADGVILITTKKGKPGSATIDASVYSGLSDV
ncbi:MAG: hypothetical protein JWQ57_4322, partial [Mucilaginibacter sp.]|nr:hypothetical protein [Mucilaginibacter sp.]